MNSLLEFISDCFFWASSKVVGFTFIVTIICIVLFAIEGYFNVFMVDPLKLKKWALRLGIFFAVFMGIGFVLFMLGSISSPSPY